MTSRTIALGILLAATACVEAEDEDPDFRDGNSAVSYQRSTNTNVLKSGCVPPIIVPGGENPEEDTEELLAFFENYIVSQVFAQQTQQYGPNVANQVCFENAMQGPGALSDIALNFDVVDVDVLGACPAKPNWVRVTFVTHAWGWVASNCH